MTNIPIYVVNEVSHCIEVMRNPYATPGTTAALYWRGIGCIEAAFNLECITFAQYCNLRVSLDKAREIAHANAQNSAR